MRCYSHRPLRWGGVVAAVVVTGLAGCSHEAHTGKAPPSPPQSSTAPNGSGAAPPGAVGLSPAGVTTRVDVPADSTEEQYYQACHAAKEWMAAQSGTGQPLLEPYLAMVQSAPAGTPGTWNARWADLTLNRQAAVITAARAAADDQCG